MVDVSIVATAPLSRVVERTSHHRKFFKKLGDKEGIIENARRRARRLIDGEGGTPFMGSKIIPIARLNSVLKKLAEQDATFYTELEEEIGAKRDEINAEVAKAIREQENREPSSDDLLPEDVSGMFDYRVQIARMVIPRVQDLQEADVEFTVAQKAIENVLKTAQETTEKSILRRFAPAYKALSTAWEIAAKGKPLPGKTKGALQSVATEIDEADTAKNPTVRAELEKFKAYVEFVVEAAKAADLKAAQARLQTTVKRVVALNNATAPVTGALEITAPVMSAPEDGLKAITDQVRRDMEANEKRFGISAEPTDAEKRKKTSDAKVRIKDVPSDGSPESVRKAWLAYAQQFERMVVK
jgi:hypothetical protein